MKRVLAFAIIFMMLISGKGFAQGESASIISSGYGSTYVIKNDGTLWGSGAQYVGNGTGYKEEQIQFVKILDDVRSVSSGDSQVSVAVKKDDTLWGWGHLQGYPDNSGSTDPKLIYPTKLDIEDVKMVSASNNFILVLKNDNSLWVCGDTYTGDGTNKKADTKKGFEKVADNVIDMFADNATVFYVTDDNVLWGYGDNNHAQLGNMEAVSQDVLAPIKILDDVKSICTNYGATVVGAIRLDNSLYLWGNGEFYTEAYGWIEDAGSPYKVMDDVKSAVVDDEEALIVKTDNTLWRWGYSYEGSSVSNEQVPYKVTDNVLNVTIGERHAAVLKTDNTLWVMGGDYRGGLGYKADETWYTPLTKVVENVQDAPAPWAYEEVEKAIGAQLIPENMQGEYTKSITREEFCILAIRMIEVKSGMGIEAYMKELGVDSAPATTFEDCDTQAVLAAKALNIVKGTSPTTFDPDMLLNREMAAVFLTRTAQACGRNVTPSTPDYADVNEISTWAKDATGYVYDIGVLKGTSGNRFDPKGSYQRQQAFMTMYRIWQAIDGVNPENVKIEKSDETDKSSDDLPINSLKKEVNNAPYHSDYLATIEGTSKDNEGTTQLKYDVYYKDANVRIDTYYEKQLVSKSVFNETANLTYTVRTLGTHYAEVLDGNWLPFRLLNIETFDLLEKDPEIKSFEWRYETLDNKEVIYTKIVMFDGVLTEQWYSTDYKIPLKFHQEWVETGDFAQIDWRVSAIDEDREFGEDVFDIPSDAQTTTSKVSGYENEINGDTRDLLLYEVKRIHADETGTDGMMNQVFYYSDASYELLVAYFKNLLEGTVDYSVYVQEGRTSIDGTINGELVIVIVNDYMTTEPEVDMNGVNINYYE